MKNPTKPDRLKRADSFLGIHFDFHAGDDCTEIGKGVTKEMIEKIIDQVKPDYLQCDCKGHRGLSSYPTTVGHPAPGFVRDQLRIWRDVTAERGVALFMHYSGVWDSEACKKHPSWAVVNANGKRDKNQTSVFGPYVDKLLIPQLKELSKEYGVDGMWVDGESWATIPDYNKKVMSLFTAETGITEIPRKPEDPHYWEYQEFCREGFRRYLRHYVDSIHQFDPDFQVASNWAFTSLMPEKVCADVDFISGDYPLQDSVNVARFESRCIAKQGKPWDLMAWAFSSRWEDQCRSTKSVVQLQQEAAMVLAMGGGFQAYFKQKRDASIFEWTMKLMADTAKFCRARQQVCHQAETVAQIALLYSTDAYYKKVQKLFAPFNGEVVAISGILNALLDNQQSVDILMEHSLTGKMSEYPLIIVPEWEYLSQEFTAELREYVKNGGNLLLIGPKSAALFEKELDITLLDEAKDAKKWIEHNGWLGGVAGLCQNVKLGKKAKPFGKMYEKDDFSDTSVPAAVITQMGKGTIAATLINVGERYRKCRISVLRDFIGAIVKEIFPNPIATVTGSHYVDVVVTRKDDKLAVNLVNTAGPHHDPGIYIYDEIPPLGPLKVSIRTGKKPKSITSQPSGKKVPFTFITDTAYMVINRLEIHDVLVVE
jgi:hypothetical protein